MVRGRHRAQARDRRRRGRRMPSTEKRVVRQSWYASPSRIASRHRSMSAGVLVGRVARPRAAGRLRRSPGIGARRRRHPTSLGERVDLVGGRDGPRPARARGRTRRSAPPAATLRRDAGIGRARPARPRARPRHARSRASRPSRRGTGPPPTPSRRRRRAHSTARTRSGVVLRHARADPAPARRRRPVRHPARSVLGESPAPAAKTDAGSRQPRERHGDERRRHVPRLEARAERLGSGRERVPHVAARRRAERRPRRADAPRRASRSCSRRACSSDSFVPGDTVVIIAATAVAIPAGGGPPRRSRSSIGALIGESIGFWLGRFLGPKIRHSRLGRRIGEENWDALGALPAPPRRPRDLHLALPPGAALARAADGRDERLPLPAVPRVDRSRVRHLGGAVHHGRGRSPRAPTASSPTSCTSPGYIFVGIIVAVPRCWSSSARRSSSGPSASTCRPTRTSDRHADRDVSIQDDVKD